MSSNKPPTPTHRLVILPLPVWLVLLIATHSWRLATWLVRFGRRWVDRSFAGYRQVVGADETGNGSAGGPIPQHHNDPDCRKLAEYLFDHLNDYRVGQGIASMKWNERLEQSALYHGHRMIEVDEFEHVLSDGVDLGDRVKRFGYHYQLCAENLAYFVSPAQTIRSLAWSMHDGWVHSPGHHANLVGDCRQVGIGVVRDGLKYYAVQNFGTPMPTTFASLMPRGPARHAARHQAPKPFPYR